MYHVLTKFPVKPAFSPGIVKQIINENIASTGQIISLSPEEYLRVIENTADYGFIGGIIFYAIIAFVAKKMKVDTILTYNVRVFKRLVQDVFVIPPCTRY